MPTNTRFAVAVHVLTLLAMNREALTSDYIAGSVQTNAVVVRRILGALRSAGIVSAVTGPGGGFLLATDARHLTLRQVYEAVEERPAIAIHSDTNPLCPVGRNIEALLERVSEKAEEAMLTKLAETTIARISSQVDRCEKAG
jgi:Rrf2 family protein